MPKFTQKEIETKLNGFNCDYSDLIDAKELTQYVNERFCWDAGWKQVEQIIQSFIHNKLNISLVPLTEFFGEES